MRQAINRDPRNNSKDDVDYVYSPPNALSVPTLKTDPEGKWVLRWMRYAMGSDDDTRYMSQRFQEGWEIVKLDEVEGTPLVQHMQPKNSSLAGGIYSGDCVLMKIPQKKANAIQRYHEDRAQMAERAYNGKKVVFRDSGDQAYALDREGETRVGRGRNSSFGA